MAPGSVLYDSEQGLREQGLREQGAQTGALRWAEGGREVDVREAWERGHMGVLWLILVDMKENHSIL